MPSNIHKIPIHEELKRSLPSQVFDLMCAVRADQACPFDRLYQMIGIVAGSLELAYRRGYEMGFNDAKNGRPEQPIKVDK